MIILIIILAWCMLGSGGFLFWHIKKYDLTSSDIPIMIMASMMGPLTWGLGYFVYFGNGNDHVIIHKKQNRAKIK